MYFVNRHSAEPSKIGHYLRKWSVIKNPKDEDVVKCLLDWDAWTTILKQLKVIE